MSATARLLTYRMTIMQDREPPAYQEYAATVLASRPFRLMNATERGVFYSMKLECWANKTLPADPGALAKILTLDVDTVSAALPTVMPLFALVGDEIVCPELDKYRTHLEDRHLRQSDGAKTARANDKTKKPKGEKVFKNIVATENVDGKTTNPQAPCKHPASNPQGLSTTQPSTTKSNPSLVSDLPPTDLWIGDYDKTSVDSAEVYRKGSGR